MDDRSALTDKLKLGEDNSDPIKVHPELKRVSPPQPCVRVLVTEIFPKISQKLKTVAYFGQRRAHSRNIWNQPLGQ